MKRPQQVSSFPLFLVAGCLAVLVFLCAGPRGLVEAKPTTAVPVFRKSAPYFTPKPRASSRQKRAKTPEWVLAFTYSPHGDWDGW